MVLFTTLSKITDQTEYIHLFKFSHLLCLLLPPQSPPSKRRKLEKPRKPLSFTLPEAGLKELQARASAAGGPSRSAVDSITALLEKTLSDLRVGSQSCIRANVRIVITINVSMFGFFFISVTLQVLHKHVPCGTQEQSLFLTAVENTWIHGRQKRRERMRQLRELPRAPLCPGIGTQTSVIPADPAVTHTQDDGSENNTRSGQEPPEQQPTEPPGGSSRDPQGEPKEKTCEADVDVESSVSTGTSAQEASAASKPIHPAESPGFLFKCQLNVMEEEGVVLVEMHWVEGQNKDLMNQLCTYLKNTLLKSVAKS